jgi:hypothetical protein
VDLAATKDDTDSAIKFEDTNLAYADFVLDPKLPA